jgi:hypothetical protein
MARKSKAALAKERLENLEETKTRLLAMSQDLWEKTYVEAAGSGSVDMAIYNEVDRIRAEAVFAEEPQSEDPDAVDGGFEIELELPEGSKLGEEKPTLEEKLKKEAEPKITTSSQIKGLAEQGLTIKQIMTELGITRFQHVYNVLRQSNYLTPKPRADQSARNIQIHKLHQEGLTCGEIKAEVGCSYQVVYNTLKGEINKAEGKEKPPQPKEIALAGAEPDAGTEPDEAEIAEPDAEQLAAIERELIEA